VEYSKIQIKHKILAVLTNNTPIISLNVSSWKFKDNMNMIKGIVIRRIVCYPSIFMKQNQT